MKLLKSAIPLLFLTGCAGKVAFTPDVVKNEIPRTVPELSQITLPVNIAPMNFKINERQEIAEVKIEGKRGGIINLRSEAVFRIPAMEWKNLLRTNANDSVSITVTIKKDDKWQQFAPIKMFVRNSEIGHGIVYRLVAPGYDTYSKTGLYERTLADFTEKEIVKNQDVPLQEMQQKHCINCHAFNQRNPATLTYHIRGKQAGTIVRNRKDEFYDLNSKDILANCTHPYYHPNGAYIAYSVNKTQQASHRLNSPRMESSDQQSDIVIFDVNSRELFSSPLINKTAQYETYPAFSKDGKKLYFCSAEPKKFPEQYKSVKYSLCSIDFDPTTKNFGNKVDTIISANETGQSILYPKPSPDGKFIMLTVTNFGCHPVWHKEADIAIYDINNKTFRVMDEINSYETESYHSWDGSGRWFVFSSRRGDGLYSRPHFAYIDENGKASKPFILPQNEPESYYDNTYFSLSMPEFIDGRVDKVDVKDLDMKVTYGRKQNVDFRE